MKLGEALKTLKNNGYIVEAYDEVKHTLYHAPEKKTVFPDEKYHFTMREWRPLNEDILRDEENKKYYRDNQSDIYIVKYKEGEPSAELYILWHGEEKFFGTIPNVEDEDFKLGLAGETIGIELDEYHYC